MSNNNHLNRSSRSFGTTVICFVTLGCLNSEVHGADHVPFFSQDVRRADAAALEQASASSTETDSQRYRHHRG